jgi:uncharacterized protein
MVMNYHVRRGEREIKEPDTLEALIKRGRYGVVGLARDNEPYVVSLSYAYDKQQHALIFHCVKTGQKLEFIKANPQACVTIVIEDGNESGSCDYPYTSLVIRWKILFVNDPVDVNRAMRLLISWQESSRNEYFLGKCVPGNKGYDNLQILKMPIDSICGKARE